MARSTKMFGLTGSIGMGKSEVARMLRELGVPVFDADSAVHALYAKGGAAVAAVAREFPKALRDGAIDRAELSRAVLNDAAALARLEAVVHPLVGEAERRFVAEAIDKGADLVVLDIRYCSRGADRGAWTERSWSARRPKPSAPASWGGRA